MREAFCGKGFVRACLASTAVFVLLSVASAMPASARTIRIVALGDSNFGAPGVSLSQAYPAQLERALRARGLDVEVTNAGKNGDTTFGVLARMDRDVPAGTDIVLLSIGVNDVAVRHQSKEETNARAGGIASTLSARGIQVLRMGTGKQFQGRIADDAKYHVEGVPGKTGPEPGTTSWHLTAEGYAIIVAGTLPQVLQAVKKAQAKR